MESPEETIGEKRKLALARVWKALDFRLDSLPERIRLQKTVYLLAKMGVNDLRDYLPDYGMYLYGPYSSAVAKDAFELSENKLAEKLNENNPLTDDEKGKIRLLTLMIRNIPVGKDDPTHSSYELLSDIIYYSTDKNKNSDEIFAEVKKKRSYLDNREKFNHAENLLRTNNLL